MSEINLYDYSYSKYSQFGQDGILAKLDELLKPKKYFVEFGSSGNDFEGTNTAALRDKGWTGLLMDGAPNAGVQQHMVSSKNINELLTQYEVPHDFGFISIDIDGQDYWVWKAMDLFRPDIVMIEANMCIGHDRKCAVPEDENFVWNRSDFYGGSRRALLELGISKGYSLVSICVSDMIFVLDKHLQNNNFANVNDLDKLDVAKTYLWVPEWRRDKCNTEDWVNV